MRTGILLFIVISLFLISLAGTAGVKAYSDVSECEKLSESSDGYRKMNECYNAIAKSQLEPSTCEKIQKSEIYLLSLCYRNFAEVKGDESICELVQNDEENNKCHNNLAIAKRNPLLCEKMTIAGQKELCIAVAKQDESSCKNLDDALRNQCYGDIAVIKQSPSLCELVQSVGQKAYCRSMIAAAKRDESLCENIIDHNEQTGKSWRDFCYSEIAKAKGGEVRSAGPNLLLVVAIAIVSVIGIIVALLKRR